MQSPKASVTVTSIESINETIGWGLLASDNVLCATTQEQYVCAVLALSIGRAVLYQFISARDVVDLITYIERARSKCGDVVKLVWCSIEHLALECYR